MITSSTMATLMATKTKLTCAEILMPSADDRGEDQHDRGGDQVVPLAVGEAGDA